MYITIFVLSILEIMLFGFLRKKAGDISFQINHIHMQGGAGGAGGAGGSASAGDNGTAIGGGGGGGGGAGPTMTTVIGISDTKKVKLYKNVTLVGLLIGLAQLIVAIVSLFK